MGTHSGEWGLFLPKNILFLYNDGPSEWLLNFPSSPALHHRQNKQTRQQQIRIILHFKTKFPSSRFVELLVPQEKG